MTRPPPPELRYQCSTCLAVTIEWKGWCVLCGSRRGLRLITPPRAVKPAPDPAAALAIGTEAGEDQGYRISTGIPSLDKVLGRPRRGTDADCGLHVPSVVLVAGAPGTGKCLVGSTRVLDPRTGALVPIAEFAPGNAVVATDTTLRAAPAPCLARLAQGVRPIVEVRTALGHVLRCTPDHPLLTPTGWTPLDRLAPGASIATPRELPFFGKEELPDHEVALLAYMLSDGHSSGTTSVTTMLPAVAADVAAIGRALGMTVRTVGGTSGRALSYRLVVPPVARRAARNRLAAALEATRLQRGLRISEWARRANVSERMLRMWLGRRAAPSPTELAALATAAGVPRARLAPEARDIADGVTPAARLLEKHGLRHSRAHNKRVPDAVFRLPRHHLRRFLRALFSCDGSLYATTRGQTGVSYATISRQLAVDVQHLLRRFGFVATLRTKTSRSGYVAYEVLLNGGLPATRRFLDVIGIEGRSAAKATIARAAAPEQAATRFDTVPTGPEFWRRFAAAVAPLSIKRAGAKAGVVLHPERPDSPLTRDVVARLARAFPVGWLKQLADNDVYWDRVVAIEPAGEEAVYDLSVDGPPNFVANDLVVHNSTLLLQSCAEMGSKRRRLFISSEQTRSEIAGNIADLGLRDRLASLPVLATEDWQLAKETMARVDPEVVVIDSHNKLRDPLFHNPADKDAASLALLTEIRNDAFANNRAVFVISHLNKKGEMKGTRELEHDVSALMMLFKVPPNRVRAVCPDKNRFGQTGVVAWFEMGDDGLTEIDPDEVAREEEQKKADKELEREIRGFGPGDFAQRPGDDDDRPF